MRTDDKRTTLLVVLGGVAVLAALWVLAISPKRTERSDVRAQVEAQQTRLDAAQAQLAGFEASRKAFPGKLAELRTLDKAVPARGAISSLLREIQRRAKVRDSDVELVALQSGGGAAAPAAGAATAPITPGATVGPDGLSALPFTFEFTGEYFDLRDILATVRKSISTSKGKLKVSGRLLTIDGLTFTREDPSSTLTKATVNATAYIAPDGAATPQPPAAPAAATTAGGS